MIVATTTLFLPLLSMSALVPAPAVQQGASLAGVKKSFDRLDSDDDGRVTVAEARKGKITPAQFRSQDANGDLRLDQQEFTVLYREFLVKAKRPVPTDLEAEVTRVLAARKAAAEAKKKEQEAKKAEQAKAARSEADGKANSAGPTGATGKDPAASAKKAPAQPAPKGEPAPASKTPQAGSPQAESPQAGSPTAAPKQVPSGAQGAKRPAIRTPAPAQGQPSNGNGPAVTAAAARQAWLKKWGEAEAKKDQDAVRAYDAKLSPELKASLLARLEKDRNQALRDWDASHPGQDITSLPPKVRGTLVQLIDRARTASRDAWASERRAEIAERIRAAKEAEKKAEGKDGEAKRGKGRVRKVKDLPKTKEPGKDEKKGG